MVLNVPWLHPNHPPYFYIRSDAKHEKRRFRCFIFIQQLTNSISWDEMEKIEQINSMHESVINTHCDILGFFLSGYDDIMLIFNRSHELWTYHNDFHEGNILINKDDNRWYLIDFGDLFIDHAYNWYNPNEDMVFKCIPHTCPPSTWYHLQSRKKRVNFRNEYNIKHGINVSESGDWLIAMDELSKLAVYSKRYEIISIMFHGFVHWYCIRVVNDNENGIGLMCKQLMEWNQWMRMYRNVNNRKGVDFDNDMIYIERWCVRQRMLYLLKRDGNNLQSLKDKRRKQRFWKLVDIYQNDLKYLNMSICDVIVKDDFFLMYQ